MSSAAPRALDCEGHLQVVGPKGALDVAARGAKIVVRAERLASLRSLLGAVPFRQRAARRRSLASLDRALCHAGLTVDLHWGRLPLLRIGSSARPRSFARLFGKRRLEWLPSRV